MYDKIKNFMLMLNEKGIPLPLLYDNVKDRGSYTLTMFVIAFNLGLILLIGKVTKLLGEVDYSNVLWLILISGGFYMSEVFGRKFTKSGDSIDVSGAEESKNKNAEPPV